MYKIKNYIKRKYVFIILKMSVKNEAYLILKFYLIKPY